MDNTLASIRSENTELFILKMSDYGPSWRILRPVSFVDQMMIKIKRLRTIQEPGYEMQVEESQADAFVALYNYSLMALINYENGHVDDITYEKPEQLISAFKMHSHEAHLLQLAKDQDYGSAWLSLSVETITDLIMQKLMRATQIIKNSGKTQVSESLSGSYYDIANYAVFALCKIKNPTVILSTDLPQVIESVDQLKTNLTSIIDYALQDRPEGVKVDEKMKDVISDIKTVYHDSDHQPTWLGSWEQSLQGYGFVLRSTVNEIYEYFCEINPDVDVIVNIHDISRRISVEIYRHKMKVWTNSHALDMAEVEQNINNFLKNGGYLN